MQEIHNLRRSTQLLIPRAPFQRIVREIVQQINAHAQLSIEKEAFEALQESVEMYLVQIFEDARLAAEHRRRITVDVKDVRLVQHIQRAGSCTSNDAHLDSSTNDTVEQIDEIEETSDANDDE